MSNEIAEVIEEQEAPQEAASETVVEVEKSENTAHLGQLRTLTPNNNRKQMSQNLLR